MTKHTHHEIGDHAACIRLVPIFNHLEDSAMNYIAEKPTRNSIKKESFCFVHKKKRILYILSIVGNPYLSIGRLWQRAASADLEPW